MAGSPGRPGDGHAGGVTTKVGFAIILMGIVVLLLRANGVIDNELADVAATIAIVFGALAIAIDGEAADNDR